jgi:hypothetical protein
MVLICWMRMVFCFNKAGRVCIDLLDAYGILF